MWTKHTNHCTTKYKLQNLTPSIIFFDFFQLDLNSFLLWIYYFFIFLFWQIPLGICITLPWGSFSWDYHAVTLSYFEGDMLPNSQQISLQVRSGMHLLMEIQLIVFLTKGFFFQKFFYWSLELTLFNKLFITLNN